MDLFRLVKPLQPVYAQRRSPQNDPEHAQSPSVGVGVQKDLSAQGTVPKDPQKAQGEQYAHVPCRQHSQGAEA